MIEKKRTQKTSIRQRFRTNLETFPNIANFFDRAALNKSFKPRLRKQETCLIHYLAGPQPVTLRYLDNALAEIGSFPRFNSKAKELAKLGSTNEGFAQFKSVLIELWFAAQFAHHNLPIICEPETVGGHKSEFMITVNNDDVYFEVRNIEPPEWVEIGAPSPIRQPRSGPLKLQDILRQAFYHLPYPYHVTLKPEDLSGDESFFVSDVQLAVEELHVLLDDIHHSRKALPLQPFKLPKNKVSRFTVLNIEKYPGAYTWFGWKESTSNRFQKLVNSAPDKITSKGQQLAPNAANVLVVGLPVWMQSLALANELIGPLIETDKGTQANNAAVKNMGQKISDYVSAFIFFQPADRDDFYPGWVDLILNPNAAVALPEAVEAILSKLSPNLN